MVKKKGENRPPAQGWYAVISKDPPVDKGTEERNREAIKRNNEKKYIYKLELHRKGHSKIRKFGTIEGSISNEMGLPYCRTYILYDTESYSVHLIIPYTFD